MLNSVLTIGYGAICNQKTCYNNIYYYFDFCGRFRQGETNNVIEKNLIKNNRGIWGIFIEKY